MTFESLFVRHLNCLAKHGLDRMKFVYAVRNTRWNPTSRPDEYLLYLKQTVHGGDPTGSGEPGDVTIERLPFCIQQTRFSLEQTDSFSLGLRLLQILNDPYQRFGWDERVVDFRVLETIHSDLRGQLSQQKYVTTHATLCNFRKKIVLVRKVG